MWHVYTMGTMGFFYFSQPYEKRKLMDIQEKGRQLY